MFEVFAHCRKVPAGSRRIFLRFLLLAYLQGKEVLYPHILYLLQERFQIIGMALFVEKDVFQKVAGTGVAYLIASYNTVLKPFDCGLFQGIVVVPSAPAPFYRY